MKPVFGLLNPVFFFILLFAILGLFILVVRWLTRQDTQSQKSLNKAMADKEALEKEAKKSKEEIGRLNSELALRNQMFEGLKGQYDELERDCERLSQSSQEGGLNSKPATPVSNP